MLPGVETKPSIPAETNGQLDLVSLAHASEYLRRAPHERTQITEFQGVPGVRLVATVEHDATLGSFNPSVGLGTSLGGTRVVEAGTLGDDPEKGAIRLAAMLASDMTKKWLALNRMVTSMYQRGEATAEEVFATMMGGSKSVIVVNSLEQFVALPEQVREEVFTQHADHIRRMDGPITAVDMFTKTGDMDVVARRTAGKLVACQSIGLGGTGNPSPTTAAGVFHAARSLIEAAGLNPNGLRYAVAGTGQVGSSLVEMLREQFTDAAIWVADKFPQKADSVSLANGPRVIPVNHRDLHRRKLDVLMPCGEAEVLTRKALSEYHPRLSVIVGAANDPWPFKNGGPDAEIVEAYFDKGISVAPAWVVNMGGILHVSTGFWQRWGGAKQSEERARELVAGVGPMTAELFRLSQEQKRPMDAVASDMAAATLFRFAKANNLNLA